MIHKILAWLLAFAAFTFAFELSRSVDRAAVTLGDPILYKITAVKNPDEKLIFPGPDASFGDFELRDLRSAEENKDGRIIETFFYTLALYKLGDAKIPSLRVMNAADTSDAKVTDPVDISVKKVTASDSADIVEIYGQEDIGRGFWFYATIALVVLALSAGVYFLDRALKRRRQEKSAPAIVLSPEEQFAKDMDALVGLCLLEKGEIKEFHLKISEVLRRYLGARLGFEALESTTFELLAMLRKKSLEKTVLRHIEEFCDINDPVKFAKWIPANDTSEKLLVISREVVRLLSAPKEPLPGSAPQAPASTIA